jgi:hypothetical protein
MKVGQSTVIWPTNHTNKTKKGRGGGTAEAKWGGTGGCQEQAAAQQRAWVRSEGVALGYNGKALREGREGVSQHILTRRPRHRRLLRDRAPLLARPKAALDALTKSWYEVNPDGTFVISNGRRVAKTSVAQDNLAAVNLGPLKTVARPFLSFLRVSSRSQS